MVVSNTRALPRVGKVTRKIQINAHETVRRECRTGLLRSTPGCMPALTCSGVCTRSEYDGPKPVTGFSGRRVRAQDKRPEARIVRGHRDMDVGSGAPSALFKARNEWI